MADAASTILVFEDDPNDVLLLKRALVLNGIENPVQVVPDGVEGVAYLTGHGKYSDREKFPLPQIIILDLKMPRMGGLEVLEFLRDNPSFRVVPTLVLSSSKISDDVARAYDFGATSYMVKPATFHDLQLLIKTVHEYWSQAVRPDRVSRKGR